MTTNYLGATKNVVRYLTFSKNKDIAESAKIFLSILEQKHEIQLSLLHNISASNIMFDHYVYVELFSDELAIFQRANNIIPTESDDGRHSFLKFITARRENPPLLRVG